MDFGWEPEEKMQKGLFITFEGLEGSGKSTQISLLENYLSAKGLPVLKTREPGATKIGQELRRLLLDKKIVFKSQFTELLLFTADRFEHLEQIVKPNMADGKIVISDRYFDSTYAYQLGGRKVSLKIINYFAKWLSVIPDLTVILDIIPEIGLERIKNRGQKGYENYQNNRFEQEELKFHYSVRRKYLVLAKKNPDRIKLIEVNQKDPTTIFQEIKHIIDKKLNLD